MSKRKFSAIDEEDERVRTAGAQTWDFNGDAPFFSSQISSATRPAPFSPTQEDEDESGDPEFEVEEEDYIIPFTIRTSITTDECAEWTQLIHVRAMHKGKEIGIAEGRYIDRDQIREYFYDAMDEPSQETLDLATELFDSRARLKSELRAGDGTGIWGNEMNTGGILFLERIAVAPDWRGKGIGRDIMEAFMKKGQSWKEEVQFVLLKPGQLNTMELHTEREGMTRQQVLASLVRDRRKSIAFWRALGFRRVASSDWFAITFDPMHAVHQLAAEDDYDPSDDDVLGGDEAQEAQSNLVNGASALYGAPSKASFRRSVDDEVDLSEEEEEEEEEKDAESDGEEDIEWPQEPGDGLELRAALVKVPDDRYIPENEQRSTNGCTCGQCLDGFFSPRMKVQMSYEAETLCDDPDLEYHSYSIHDGDVKRRSKHDAELREGYSNVFRAIVRVIEAGHVPYPSKVIEEAEDSDWDISYFTEIGGEVETVLAHCLRDAMIEASDHGFYDVYKDDLEKLPKCDNDVEFEKVGELLGLRKHHM